MKKNNKHRQAKLFVVLSLVITLFVFPDQSKLDQESGQENPDLPLRHFFSMYQLILEDIKNNCLNFPLDEYMKMAEYIKIQEGEKWVLNFYQIGHLPLLDSFGGISKTIESLIGTTTRSGGRSSKSRFGSDDIFCLKNVFVGDAINIIKK